MFNLHNNKTVQPVIPVKVLILPKFENGERTPPTETLLLLADFYGVSLDYLLCRTENPKINK